MKNRNGPIMLDDYVRRKQKRQMKCRLALAAGLLILAAALRIFLPESAATVRTWIFGSGTPSEAVTAVYQCITGKISAQSAVEVICLAADGT